MSLETMSTCALGAGLAQTSGLVRLSIQKTLVRLLLSHHALNRLPCEGVRSNLCVRTNSIRRNCRGKQNVSKVGLSCAAGPFLLHRVVPMACGCYVAPPLAALTKRNESPRSRRVPLRAQLWPSAPFAAAWVAVVTERGGVLDKAGRRAGGRAGRARRPRQRRSVLRRVFVD